MTQRAGAPRSTPDVRGIVARAIFVVPLVAAIVPPLLVARAAARFVVNVPFWDEWEMIPLLESARRGQLSIDALWAQHNEHRIMLPRLVWLAIAEVFGWNEPAMVAFNIVTAFGTLIVLALLIRRTVGRVAPAAANWVLLVASFLTFSFAQWENWTWGWQATIFLNVFAVTLAVWLLSRWNGRWAGLLAPIAASVVGALSFGAGLVFLALLPAAVLLAPGERTRWTRVAQTLVVGAIVVICAAVYLTGWHHPSYHPSVGTCLAEPASFARYVLAYLGAGIGAQGARSAVTWGAAGIALFAGCAAWLAFGPLPRRDAVLPWALLAAYAAMNAAITGIGRVGFGVEQALSPRYVTMAMLFWVSLAAVVALSGKGFIERRGAIARLAFTGFVAAAALLAARTYASSWRGGEQGLASREAILRLGADCVRHADVAPDACLQRVYPNPETIRARVPILRELGVGPFAARGLERPLAAYALVEERGGQIDGLTVTQSLDVEQVAVHGWAADPMRRRPPATVLIAVDGDVIGRTAPAFRRRDVATALGRAFRQSGWRFLTPAFQFGAGSHLIEAYAVVDDNRLARLDGARSFTIDGQPLRR